jgi:hypothetical protein
MLICMFHTGPMDGLPGDLNLTGKGIRDEEIADSAPLVRALAVQRLEQIWRACEPQILGVSGKPDPRFIEAGIRVVDRLARLYRLDQPVAGTLEQDEDKVQVASMVSRGLEELEARMADGTLG